MVEKNVRHNVVGTLCVTKFGVMRTVKPSTTTKLIMGEGNGN